MFRGEVLSDDLWNRLEPLLPPLKGSMGRPMTPHRPVVEGLLYRYRTAVPWRDLPEQFGPWQTVWKRHNKFSKDGTWDRVLTALQAQADAAGEIDWGVSVDSTIARAHQHATNTTRPQAGPTSLTGGSTE
jgi:transposase